MKSVTYESSGSKTLRYFENYLLRYYRRKETQTGERRNYIVLFSVCTEPSLLHSFVLGQGNFHDFWGMWSLPSMACRIAITKFSGFSIWNTAFRLSPIDVLGFWSEKKGDPSSWGTKNSSDKINVNPLETDTLSWGLWNWVSHVWLTWVSVPISSNLGNLARLRHRPWIMVHLSLSRELSSALWKNLSPLFSTVLSGIIYLVPLTSHSGFPFHPGKFLSMSNFEWQLF